VLVGLLNCGAWLVALSAVVPQGVPRARRVAYGARVRLRGARLLAVVPDAARLVGDRIRHHGPRGRGLGLQQRKVRALAAAQRARRHAVHGAVVDALLLVEGVEEPAAQPSARAQPLLAPDLDVAMDEGQLCADHEQEARGQPHLRLCLRVLVLPLHDQDGRSLGIVQVLLYPDGDLSRLGML